MPSGLGTAARRADPTTAGPVPEAGGGGHDSRRVGSSRVTPDTVVAAFYTGATAEEIAQQVITYCLRHRSEVIGSIPVGGSRA